MNRQEAMKIIESNRPIYRDWQEESMKIIKSNGPIYRDGQEEFDEAVERLKQPLTLAEFLGWEVGAAYKDKYGQIFSLREQNDLRRYIEEGERWGSVIAKWSGYKIDLLRKAEKVEHKKTYRIPLPNLITTDGMQQYLTERDGNWFANSLTDTLKQEWTEDEFHSIPTAYLGYAKEMGRDEDSDGFNVEVWRWADE